MHLFVIYVPWIGSVLAELFLLGVMFRNRLFRRFPWFFTSIAYDIVRQALSAIALAWPHVHAHFYVYWISMPLEYTFAFAVICEVFRRAFQTRIQFSPESIRIFVGLNVLLLIASAALIFSGELPITGFAGLMLMLDRSAEFLRCGMLLFLWIFASELRLTWWHQLWGIAFGLGMYSAIGLITAAVDVATGKMCSHWLTPIPHFAYFFATVVWGIYFLKPEPARESLTVERINFVREWLDFVRNATLEMKRVLHDDD